MIDIRYLKPEPFLELAAQLTGISNPTEVVFETDRQGQLIRVQVLQTSQNSAKEIEL